MLEGSSSSICSRRKEAESFVMSVARCPSLHAFTNWISGNSAGIKLQDKERLGEAWQSGRVTGLINLSLFSFYFFFSLPLFTCVPFNMSTRFLDLYPFIFLFHSLVFSASPSFSPFSPLSLCPSFEVETLRKGQRATQKEPRPRDNSEEISRVNLQAPLDKPFFLMAGFLALFGDDFPERNF